MSLFRCDGLIFESGIVRGVAVRQLDGIPVSMVMPLAIRARLHAIGDPRGWNRPQNWLDPIDLAHRA